MSSIVKSQYHRLVTKIKECFISQDAFLSSHLDRLAPMASLRCIWPELNVFSYGKMAGFFSGRAMTSDYIEKGARFWLSYIYYLAVVCFSLC